MTARKQSYENTSDIDRDRNLRETGKIISCILILCEQHIMYGPVKSKSPGDHGRSQRQNQIMVITIRYHNKKTVTQECHIGLNTERQCQWLI